MAAILDSERRAPRAPEETTFDPGRARALVRAILSSPSRHRRAFAIAFLSVFALSAPGVMLVSPQYGADVTILDHTDNTMKEFTSVLPRENDVHLRSAREVVMSRDNLVALCEQTDFVARSRARRSLLARAMERLRSALTGDVPRPEALLEATVDQIEKKIWVEATSATTIRIDFAWTDPDLAYDYLRAAADRYLETRRSVEVTAVSEAISVLRAHNEDVHRQAQEIAMELERGGAPLPSAGSTDLDVILPLAGRVVADKRLNAVERMATAIPDAKVDVPGAEGFLAAHGLAGDGARAASPAERPRAERSRPRVAVRHSQLTALLREHARLSERISTAAMDLDSAKAAFDRNHAIVGAPEVPAAPMRSRWRIFFGTGIFGGLVVALFASAVADMTAWAGAAPGPRRKPWLLPGASGFEGRRAWLVAGVGIATVAIGVASGGKLPLVLAPSLLAALAYAVLRVPLRWTANVLVFLLLALEVSGDALGVWSTPLIRLGDLLTDNSGATTGVKIAGIEVVLLLLVGVALHRRSVGSTIDGPVPPELATLVRDAIVVYLVGFLYAEALGLLRGQDLVVWKARYLLYVPALFALFRLAYRRPADLLPLGAVVVAAGHYKTVLAAWVQKVAAPAATGGELAFGTNHGDSILFVMAIAIALAPALELPSRRNVLRAALLVPFPAWGLVLNQRRTAWAMLGTIVAFLFLVTPKRPWKRSLGRGLVVAGPILALYVGAGWSSGGGALFAPVRQVRSMLDSNVDGSTYWREVENFNIATSLRESLFVGTGLGGEYTESMFNDDISVWYPDYRRWPHNTVLGLLLYGGLLGFAGLWLVYPVTVFLAMRSYRMSCDPSERAMALTCVAAVICCLSLAWGDTGLHFMQQKLATALVLAASGTLALATGAWPSRRPRPASPR